jgi:hypothetical protein
MAYGQITPFRAQDIFENFWVDQWHDLDDSVPFKPILRTKWSRNLDKVFQ